MRRTIMKLTLERLQHEHSRLNRLIDSCRNGPSYSKITALKRMRLKIKDRIAHLQRRANPATP